MKKRTTLNRLIVLAEIYEDVALHAKCKKFIRKTSKIDRKNLQKVKKEYILYLELLVASTHKVEKSDCKVWLFVCIDFFYKIRYSVCADRK